MGKMVNPVEVDAVSRVAVRDDCLRGQMSNILGKGQSVPPHAEM